MRYVGQGFGGSLAGAPLRRRVESGLGSQKHLVKLTFRSQNCKRTESGAIMGNPLFRRFKKGMKTSGFGRFLKENHEKHIKDHMKKPYENHMKKPYEKMT